MERKVRAFEELDFDVFALAVQHKAWIARGGAQALCFKPAAQLSRSPFALQRRQLVMVRPPWREGSVYGQAHLRIDRVHRRPPELPSRITQACATMLEFDLAHLDDDLDVRIVGMSPCSRSMCGKKACS